MTTAIRDSCNYYFFNVGYQLSIRSGVYNETEGLNTLYRYADQYGLTEKSGVEITEYEPDFSDIDPARSSIGQGGTSYTTAGLARYITTVANSGTCYYLTLIDRITDSEGVVLEEHEPDIRNTVELPQEYWNAIHLGMRQHCLYVTRPTRSRRSPWPSGFPSDILRIMRPRRQGISLSTIMVWRKRRS